ncbi:MAG: glycoside hydrolase family 2, partial [Sphingobacteriales bacterium]
MKHLLYIIVFFSLKQACAQRIVLPFNNDWQFSKDNFSFNNKVVQWHNINLPHTWNIADVMDDEPGYYRGPAYYKKEFTLPKNMRNKELYLLIEGANQQAEVFVNGKKLNEHIGGYTAFFTRLSPLLIGNIKNELIIKVDN